MKIFLSALVGVSLVGCLATVGPDGRVVGGQAEFTLVLPEILPPLIVVEPGVSVVGNLDHEVFFSDGYYWARQDQSWYRSTDHRRGWSRVEERSVPARISRTPPGQYRRYQGGAPHHDEGREGDRH